MHDRIYRYLEEKISKFKNELNYCSRNRADAYGQMASVLDVWRELPRKNCPPSKTLWAPSLVSERTTTTPS